MKINWHLPVHLSILMQSGETRFLETQCILVAAFAFDKNLRRDDVTFCPFLNTPHSAFCEPEPLPH